jgi:hypothetical protein
MQSQRLARVRLGAIGFRHISDRLHVDPSEYTAKKPLRRALAQLPLDQGVAWTWAPRESVPTLAELRGGILPGRTKQTRHRNLLVHFVLKYLTSNGDLALIEDESMKPGDPWLTKEPPLPQWLGVGKHLYWYVTEPDIAVIRKVLVWGLGFFQCMALIPSIGEWPPDKRLSSVQIERLAQTADHIVVDAFDFWGYVIWSRSPTSD